jgi:cytochrome bd-type quinol oxidase subunit 1
VTWKIHSLTLPFGIASISHLTITYHYLFPQLTMGLAWFLVYWKWRALRTGDEKYNRAARFWAKIFGLNFAVGVVTGIPMEFQFGTNWAAFSRYSGAMIGQTLAMEGMFAFFLESAFIGALIWGGARTGLFVPAFNRLFVAVPHRGLQSARVLVYDVKRD